LCFALLIPLTVALVVYGQAPPTPAAPAAPAAETAPTAPGGATTEEGASTKVSFFQMLKWAGIVGYILVALSITTLALVFKHVFALRRTTLMPPHAIDQLEQLIGQKKIKEAIDFCKTEDSTICKMMGAGLGELRHGYEDAVEIMTEVGEEEVIRHNAGISLFGMIANVGPMLGLLGTVSGMVTTFNKIATAMGAVKPAQLAEGIQEALVNTVLGLAVAIPNVCVFTLLKNRVTRMFLQLGVVTEELMSPLKGLRVVSGAAPGGMPTGAPLPSAARAAGIPPTAARPAQAPPGASQS
jgi:biopolymer transport protein ExbB